MKYIESAVGYEADELQGGVEYALETYVVNVESGASISRGDLLAGMSMSGVFSIAGASDASKVLMIAAEDFVADSLNTATVAYGSGKFNRDKITFGGTSLSIDPFEGELRKQGIILTRRNKHE